MKFRARTAFLVLTAVMVVGLCAALPHLVSGYQDRSIEEKVNTQGIRDLSLTVQSPSSFAKLFLSSSRMNIVSFPESRAVHTREEIYYIALEYFVRFQEAGLIGPDFTISDYECNFRMHNYVLQQQSFNNNFWHINLYCRPDTGKNKTDGAPLFTFTLTIDDESGKAYNLYYAETTEMDFGRPAADPAEAAEILKKLYVEDLGLFDFAEPEPESITEISMDLYYDMWLLMVDQEAPGIPEEGVEPAQPVYAMSEVFIEFYTSYSSYFIVVTPSEKAQRG